MSQSTTEAQPKKTAQGPVTNVGVAKEVEQIKSFDPELGAYSFADLGQVVQFADLMSKAGPMIPQFCRDEPALCLAITMRATNWGFDPFALANEAYQAKSGGPVGYQAKAFIGALLTRGGIKLKYRYEGSVKMLDQPFKSANGNQVAARTAVGDRKCIAYWNDADGELYEYETPTLDNITVKNNPQWQNDPDQQLAYFAGRGWGRRHRPDIIMGAFSIDEVREMSVEVKDVTPKETGFARLANNARRQAERAASQEQDGSGETSPTDEAEDDTSAGAEGAENAEEGTEVDGDTEGKSILDLLSDEYLAGIAAAEAGESRSACPHFNDPAQTERWFAGWDSVNEAENAAA